MISPALMLLGAACSPAELPVVTELSLPTNVPVATSKPTDTSVPEQIVQNTEEVKPTEAVEITGADCPGEEVNSIGQGIADEYQFTDYEEVMIWFCDGAEFEDILVALQTEDQSSFPAEEMLVMLAEGLSWEDIWLVVGLME